MLPCSQTDLIVSSHCVSMSVTVTPVNSWWNQSCFIMSRRAQILLQRGAEDFINKGEWLPVVPEHVVPPPVWPRGFEHPASRH